MWGQSRMLCCSRHPMAGTSSPARSTGIGTGPEPRQPGPTCATSALSDGQWHQRHDVVHYTAAVSDLAPATVDMLIGDLVGEIASNKGHIRITDDGLSFLVR